MKILDIEPIPVWYEPTDAYRRLFGSSKKAGTMVHAREGWFAGVRLKENVFVKVTTDEGIVGWGEACAHPVTSETQAGIVSTIKLFAQTVRGRDPFQIGAIHAALDHLFLHGNAGARSAIDIALYDIMGKATGQPVSSFLGGAFRSSFGRLATMPRDEPAAMAESAVALIEQGYTCFEPKMTGHLETLDADADRLEAILDRVPKSALVIADPNQTWGTAKDTIALLQRRFSGVANLAVEQPVMYHDREGLAAITRAVPHMVVADEAIQTISDALTIAAHRTADMISLKLGKCGGFYKAAQMMRIAEAAGLPVRVDWTQGSRLLDTATGHLHAAIRLAACDPGMDYHLRIADEPVAAGGAVVENGRVVMPTGPGLGLEIDEDLLRRLSERK
jgi:L-alanine-DL-glutamate epimerase-like enolase superfamily enzyme